MDNLAKAYNLRYYLFSLIFIVVGISFVKNTFDMMKNTSRLEKLREQVVILEEDKANLTSSITYQKTDEYIEIEARNKLNMIKPNEQIYVVDKSLAEVLGETGEDTFVKNAVDVGHETSNLSNLRRWLNLFF